MATLSSTLAWRIPRTEEPGGLQSMGSQRGGHDQEASPLACPEVSIPELSLRTGHPFHWDKLDASGPTVHPTGNPALPGFLLFLP